MLLVNGRNVVDRCIVSLIRRHASSARQAKHLFQPGLEAPAYIRY